MWTQSVVQRWTSSQALHITFLARSCAKRSLTHDDFISEFAPKVNNVLECGDWKTAVSIFATTSQPNGAIASCCLHALTTRRMWHSALQYWQGPLVQHSLFHSQAVARYVSYAARCSRNVAAVMDLLGVAVKLGRPLTSSLGVIAISDALHTVVNEDDLWREAVVLFQSIISNNGVKSPNGEFELVADAAFRDFCVVLRRSCRGHVTERILTRVLDVRPEVVRAANQKHDDELKRLLPLVSEALQLRVANDNNNAATPTSSQSSRVLSTHEIAISRIHIDGLPKVWRARAIANDGPNQSSLQQLHEVCLRRLETFSGIVPVDVALDLVANPPFFSSAQRLDKYCYSHMLQRLCNVCLRAAVHSRKAPQIRQILQLIIEEHTQCQVPATLLNLILTSEPSAFPLALACMRKNCAVKSPNDNSNEYQFSEDFLSRTLHRMCDRGHNATAVEVAKIYLSSSCEQRQLQMCRRDFDTNTLYAFMRCVGGGFNKDWAFALSLFQNCVINRGHEYITARFPEKSAHFFISSAASDWQRSLEFFSLAEAHGVRTDGRTLRFVLSQSNRLVCWDAVLALYHTRKEQFHTDLSPSRALLKLLSRQHRWSEAIHYYQRMTSPEATSDNVCAMLTFQSARRVSWQHACLVLRVVGDAIVGVESAVNVLQCHLSYGRWDVALSVLKTLDSHKLLEAAHIDAVIRDLLMRRKNVFVAKHVMSTYPNHTGLSAHLFNAALSSGATPTTTSSSSASSSSWVHGLRVFVRGDAIRTDWGYRDMLAILREAGHWHAAVKLFHFSRRDLGLISPEVLTSALYVCAQHRRWDLALGLFAHGAASGMTMTGTMYEKVLVAFCRRNRGTAAIYVLKSALERSQDMPTSSNLSMEVVGAMFHLPCTWLDAVRIAGHGVMRHPQIAIAALKVTSMISWQACLSLAAVRCCTKEPLTMPMRTIVLSCLMTNGMAHKAQEFLETG
eukprot:PhM_4_TR9162/c0_g1_i1/m.40101